MINYRDGSLGIQLYILLWSDLNGQEEGKRGRNIEVPFLPVILLFIYIFFSVISIFGQS